MSFLTIDEVKEEMSALGISLSSWEGDGSFSRLQNLIDRTEKAIQKMLNRDLTYRTDFERFYDGTGKEVLVLLDYPIIKISSVSFVNGDISEVVDLSGITVDYEKGILFADLFPEGRRNIYVKGDFGYEELPADLHEAFLYSVVLKTISLSPNENERIGLKSIRIGEVSKTYNGIFSNLKQDLSNQVNTILEKYRRNLVG